MTISAEKKLGHNTLFKQSTTAIAQVKTIKPPGTKRDDINVTTLDSTIEDFIPGDPKEVTPSNVSGIWVGGLASQELLQTSCDSSSDDTYSIVVQSWTTNRTGTFTAYCLEYDPQEISSKEALAFNATFRPTSVVTWS